jgi:hypothetical protein
LLSVAPQVETKSYAPFVGAANQSLLRLSELDMPGLVASKDNKDLSDILFHHNDHPMFQTHQGETSERKPDVVIIPWKTARAARNNGDIYKKNDMYLHCKTACAKPDSNFKWPETVSTVEFKRTRSTLDAPPSGYEVRDYNVPTSHQYMEYRKETPKPAEATGSRPVPAPASQPSNERKPPGVSSCCSSLTCTMQRNVSPRGSNSKANVHPTMHPPTSRKASEQRAKMRSLRTTTKRRKKSILSFRTAFMPRRCLRLISRGGTSSHL